MHSHPGNPVRHKLCASGLTLIERMVNLRADLDGGIVPAMVGRRKREIRDQDVQGLKCLRKIRLLLRGAGSGSKRSHGWRSAADMQ
jgi:hypothetical protein